MSVRGKIADITKKLYDQIGANGGNGLLTANSVSGSGEPCIVVVARGGVAMQIDALVRNWVDEEAKRDPSGTVHQNEPPPWIRGNA